MVAPPFYLASTNNTFLLKLDKLSWDDAEACCNKFCAHLAAYDSQFEQSEVRRKAAAAAAACGQ